MSGIDLQGYSLSPQQARLWAWQKKCSIYHTLCAIQIEGILDRCKFKRAIGSIVKRHEILHTLFHTSPGMDVPLQVIGDDHLWSLAEVSLDLLDASHQRRELDDLFTALQNDIYDLQHGPLLQIWLFRITVDKYIVVINLPALCADSHSMSIFTNELARAYARKTLPREVLQYADVTTWLEDLLHGDQATPERLYWQRMDLSQMFSRNLPFAREAYSAEKGSSNNFIPDIQEISLSDELIQQIEITSRYHDVSLSSFLLACWQILLWQLSEGTVCAVGVAGDGRIYDDLKSAFGLYTRFIPVSSHFEQERSFNVFLVSVDRSFQQAIKQQMYFGREEVSNQEDSTGPAFFL
jgi:hypothetical protein